MTAPTQHGPRTVRLRRLGRLRRLRVLDTACDSGSEPCGVRGCRRAPRNVLSFDCHACPGHHEVVLCPQHEDAVRRYMTRRGPR